MKKTLWMTMTLFLAFFTPCSAKDTNTQPSNLPAISEDHPTEQFSVLVFSDGCKIEMEPTKGFRLEVFIKPDGTPDFNNVAAFGHVHYKVADGSCGVVQIRRRVVTKVATK